MHIHLPKSPKSLGELVTEVGVIVVGIAIALTGEWLISSWEWHEKIVAARESMGNELGNDDGAQAYVRMALGRCIDTNLGAVRTAVENGADRASVVAAINRISIPSYTWDSDTYESAKLNGVFGRIDNAEQRKWTAAYILMPLMDRTDELEKRDLQDLRALSAVGDALSDGERNDTLRAVVRIQADNQRLYERSVWIGHMMRDFRIGLSELGRQVVHADPLPHIQAGGCKVDLDKALDPANLPNLERVIRWN